ncbi:hypothetical protein [Rossellomorea marisflavi]|uniref:hypothetical protein n=1 Tax=Rossellomorea marisflavi TaxID=189381 RepID=UPI003D2EA123
MSLVYNSILDPFLDAKFYADDLASRGATQADHARADELLRQRESELFAEYRLDTETPEGSAKFDRLLELADAYRQDETKYEALSEFASGLSHE